MSKKLKVLCIYTVDDYFSIDKPLQTNEQIPFGISMIATIIKNYGADVDLMVLTNKTYNQYISEYMESKIPDLVCVTSVSSQFGLVKKITSYLKNISEDPFILLGGHHASLAPDDAIMEPSIDAICVGEGDHVINNILDLISQQKPISNVPHLWIKKDGFIEKNERLPFEQNLDQLPFIDRQMWEEWVAFPDSSASVLVGRGCPYICTYCSNHAMKKLSKGKYVRYRSPENLIKEIEMICSNKDINYIYLEVETIGADITIANDIFELLKDFNDRRVENDIGVEKINFGMNLAYHSNFSRDREKLHTFLDKCRGSNVVQLNIGLESGSERVRKEILRRPKHTNEELVSFLSLVNQYDIKVNLFLLMGVPGETPKDFKKSISLIRKIQPHYVFLSIFYPYIGTDLYNVALDKGLIDSGSLDSTNERTKPILKSTDYHSWEIRRDYILFWYYCYKGNWSYVKIFMYTIKAIISSYPSIQEKYRYLISNSNFLVKIKNRILFSTN